MKRENAPKTIAFYLPQFHATPENDEWWGEGFTEWTNVSRAQKLFDAHILTRSVEPLGEYDLSDVGAMHSQAALAERFDIDAFCFYYYWFDGHRLLEKPLNNYLSEGPDFPFCISWANESWTRRWDGKEHEVLIGQRYDEDTAANVFNDFLPYLTDPRYVRINDKPVIVVHRADQLPPGFSKTWRDLALQHGMAGVYLIAAETKPGMRPEQFAFDAICEFPPVGSNTLASARFAPIQGLNPSFSGRILSYPRLARQFMRRKQDGFIRHRGVTPRWDNTPRRQSKAVLYVESSPAMYATWLKSARRSEYLDRGANGLVFVNAWNEWAEGAHLEPDDKYGQSYLEATRRDVNVSELPNATQVKSGIPSITWLRGMILLTAASALATWRKLKHAISWVVTR